MIARAYIFPVCAPGASEGLVFVSAVTQVESVAPHAPAVGPGVEPPLPGCHSHPVTLTALPPLRRAVNFTLGAGWTGAGGGRRGGRGGGGGGRGRGGGVGGAVAGRVASALGRGA